LELVQKYDAGEIGLEAIPVMSLLMYHCDGNEETGEIGHMQFIPESMPNGTPNMQRAQFKEALQQSSEVVVNGQKKIAAEQEKAAREAGETDGGQSVNENRALGDAEVALMEVQAKAAAEAEAREQRRQDHEQMMQLRAEDSAQTRAHKDAAFAQEQSIQKAKAEAEIAKLMAASGFQQAA
jgi:hypothetical protein